MVKTLKNGVSVILMRKQYFIFLNRLSGLARWRSIANQSEIWLWAPVWKPVIEKISEREREKELWLPLRFLLAQMFQPYQEAQEEASEIWRILLAGRHNRKNNQKPNPLGAQILMNGRLWVNLFWIVHLAVNPKNQKRITKKPKSTHPKSLPR